MNFDRDVSVVVIEQMRFALQDSTVDVVRFLETQTKIPPSQWAALLLWLLEMEYEVYTEIEDEGHGSSAWAKRRLKSSYKFFIVFHHVTRHIMAMIKSGVFLNATVRAWRPVYQCKNKKVDMGFTLLHAVLLRCVLENKHIKSVTCGMSPARASVWKQCLREVYDLDNVV